MVILIIFDVFFVSFSFFLRFYFVCFQFLFSSYIVFVSNLCSYCFQLLLMIILFNLKKIVFNCLYLLIHNFI